MVDPEIKTKLRILFNLTNAACKHAFAHRDKINDAVNWADLRCVEAMYCVNQHGAESYIVLVEEAAPSSKEFRQFIYNYLQDEGIEGVEVRIEW